MSRRYADLLGHLREVVAGKVGAAMLSQALLSLGSFVLGAAVARWTAKSEYAVFFVLFSTLGIVENVQNALANTPLTVLLTDRSPGERGPFAAALARAQLPLFVVLGLLAMAITPLAVPRGGAPPALIGVAFGLAIFAVVARDFVRTWHLADLSIRRVIQMDVCVAALLAVLVVTVTATGRLSAVTAIGALAAAFAAAAWLGYGTSSWRMQHGAGQVRAAVRATWPHGRWALLGVLVAAAQSRGYIYITSSSVGLEQLADLGAARLVMMPVGMLVISSVRIVIARGAMLLDGSAGAAGRLVRFTMVLSGALCGAWLAYSVLLLVAYQPIVAVLGPKYQHIQQLVALWGGYFLLTAVRFPAKNALLVHRRFRTVTRNDAVATAATLLSCVVLVGPLGAPGALLGLIVGELVLAVLTLFELRRCTVQQARRPPAVPAGSARRPASITGAPAARESGWVR